MITFIINPQAGKNDKSKVVDTIEKVMQTRKHLYQIVYSTKHREIVSLVNFLSPNSSRVVIAGGDGSVQEAIEGLVGAGWPCALGIIPCGTGNDLARSLHLPLNLEESVIFAAESQPIPMHLGRINDHFFANIASTGLDSEISEYREKLKPYIAGPISYLIAAIMRVITYKPTTYEIKVDGVSIKGNYALIAIASGKYYGGGMKIAPDADMTSHQFNVVAVQYLKPLKLLSLLPTVYSGKHVKTPYVEQYYGSHVEITSGGRTMSINYDGEICEGTTLLATKTPEKEAMVVGRI